MTLRLKAVIVAVNLSLLLWAGLIAGGAWAWNAARSNVDQQTTAGIVN